jgi:hypothetical protein
MVSVLCIATSAHRSIHMQTHQSLKRIILNHALLLLLLLLALAPYPAFVSGQPFFLPASLVRHLHLVLQVETLESIATADI